MSPFGGFVAGEPAQRGCHAPRYPRRHLVGTFAGSAKSEEGRERCKSSVGRGGDRRSALFPCHSGWMASRHPRAGRRHEVCDPFSDWPRCSSLTEAAPPVRRASPSGKTARAAPHPGVRTHPDAAGKPIPRRGNARPATPLGSLGSAIELRAKSIGLSPTPGPRREGSRGMKKEIPAVVPAAALGVRRRAAQRREARALQPLPRRHQRGGRLKTDQITDDGGEVPDHYRTLFGAMAAKRRPGPEKREHRQIVEVLA